MHDVGRRGEQVFECLKYSVLRVHNNDGARYQPPSCLSSLSNILQYSIVSNIEVRFIFIQL